MAASIGTAIFATLLTNFMQSKPAVEQAAELNAATGGSEDPNVIGQAAAELGIDPASVLGLLEAVPGQMAEAFASVFTVATVLVALCLVPAFFLPRQKVEAPSEPIVIH